MSVQAETAVLGAALLSDKAADLACDLLAPDDMQREGNRTVLGRVTRQTPSRSHGCWHAATGSTRSAARSPCTT